jgi:hypothetical protein
MKFAKWLVERNQRDATKMPERKSDFELFQRAARKNMHSMKHGRAGTIDTNKHKGSRGGKKRNAIDRSSQGE